MREGSSPLSRGILKARPSDLGRDRIIPALAGNTEYSALYSNLDRDHPRSRGEYFRR